MKSGKLTRWGVQIRRGEAGLRQKIQKLISGGGEGLLFGTGEYFDQLI